MARLTLYYLRRSRIRTRLRSLTLLTILLGLAGFAGSGSAASQHAESTVRNARGDGIGKTYMDREIARVMSWHGAAWLERASRDVEERGDLLLAALALRPGMRVADIGAGSGWFSRRLARAVRGVGDDLRGGGDERGVVYAVDVQPEMLRLLQTRARAEHITNIRPVLASSVNVNLRPDSIELAILIDVYHELEYPAEVLSSVIAALVPGGRIVLVEYRAEDPNVPIRPLHRMSVRQVRRELNLPSLRFERLISSLPLQHILVFRKLPAAPR